MKQRFRTSICVWLSQQVELQNVSATGAYFQDMAVETLLKICNKCKRKFVQHQPGESMPFVAEILSGIPDIIQDLNTYQTNTFYESVALMIRAEQHDPLRDEYLVCSAILQEFPRHD
jgi:hypothetical protein